MVNLTPQNDKAPHYLHQEFPCVLYHRGPFGKPESRVFQRPEDVPGDDWYGSPADVPAAPKKPAAAKRGRKPRNGSSAPAET